MAESNNRVKLTLGDVSLKFADFYPDFKVGFIAYNDENTRSDFLFIKAVKDVCAKMGIKESNYHIFTNVPTSECLSRADQLAREGCSVVFTNKDIYEETFREAADLNPETYYIILSSIDNNYDSRRNFAISHGDNYDIYCKLINDWIINYLDFTHRELFPLTDGTYYGYMSWKDNNYFANGQDSIQLFVMNLEREIPVSHLYESTYDGLIVLYEKDMPGEYLLDIDSVKLEGNSYIIYGHELETGKQLQVRVSNNAACRLMLNVNIEMSNYVSLKDDFSIEEYNGGLIEVSHSPAKKLNEWFSSKSYISLQFVSFTLSKRQITDLTLEYIS